MERTREARRHDTAAGMGPPSKRRHGTAAHRDSPEEGPTEFQETVRLRDRVSRRERDRDSLDRNKRRRVERFMLASNREGGDASTDESMGGKEEDETENRGSHSYHSQRNSSLSAGVSRPPPPPPHSTAVDEVVGFAVPRKARSSSVKRSHDYSVSGNVSASPTRRSCEAISPATSNLSAGIKTKGTSNVSKSSTESQDNIEIEIAEVLYGLMKQSKCSKKERFTPNPSQKLESNNSNGVVIGSEQPTKRETPQSLTSKKCDASVHVASVSMEIQKEAAEQESSKRMNTESGDGDGFGTAETIVMPKEESPPFPKFYNGLQGLTMTKGISTILGDQNQQEKINSNSKNLAKTSSLDKIGLVDLRLEPDLPVQNDSKSKETLVNEVVVVEVEETKRKSTQEISLLLTIDLEKDGQEKNQKRQRQAEPAIPKKEKTVPPSSSALTNNVPVWARSLLPIGCMPTQSTIMSIDGNTGTSKALQPRTKRCATHHHIARNIYLHQQIVQMNKFRPAPASSASIYDTTACNLSLMLPPNPMQEGSVSENVNSSTHGEGIASGRSEKNRTVGVATNSTDNAQRKQLVLQQAPQPASVANLQPGPALFFPISQNQAPTATGTTQPGAPKPISSTSNPSPSSNSVARAPPTTTALPAGPATMSFSYPIIAANGYPIPISNPFGTAPPMPYFNGSFYSPQMFHPLPASTGSSSSPPSQKKLQTQQPRGSQNGHNLSTSTGAMQIKHPQKQQLNPPPSDLAGTKPRQQQSSKGGAELIPQTFTVSFASPHGNTMASNISFSSMAQNPVLFQNLPQAAKQGYQVLSSGQMAQQQRHYQEPKPVASGKPSPSPDNSARTLNFKSPPVIGNWPPCSITIAAPVAPPNPPNPNYQLQQRAAQQPAPPSTNLASSTRFQNSTVIFSQTPNQVNAFSQSQSQWNKMNSSRNSAPSMAPSSTSSSLRARTTTQGQTHISFTSVSDSTDGNGKTNWNPRPASSSGGSKAGASSPAVQQIDSGSTRMSQKSSPVCGRNVPSILMSPPGNQLSELKH